MNTCTRTPVIPDYLTHTFYFDFFSLVFLRMPPWFFLFLQTFFQKFLLVESMIKGLEGFLFTNPFQNCIRDSSKDSYRGISNFFSIIPSENSSGIPLKFFERFLREFHAISSEISTDIFRKKSLKNSWKPLELVRPKTPRIFRNYFRNLFGDASGYFSVSLNYYFLILIQNVFLGIYQRIFKKVFIENLQRVFQFLQFSSKTHFFWNVFIGFL